MGGMIASVAEGSAGEALGLLPGDEIVSVNGRPLRDILDYRFEAADGITRLAALREGELLSLRTAALRPTAPVNDLGVEFRDDLFDGVMTCSSRCVFCFVDQLPKGLRRSVYVKDDDYRLSFLGGNFITLTTLAPRDWARIRRMRLSPLYVSVHATDDRIRGALLGRRGLPPIMKQLERLKGGGTQVHAQIVLCPGINDGEVLSETVSDLASLFPAVKSVGVVPVGITRFCKSPAIRPVGARLARETAERVGVWQSGFKASLGHPFVFAADEFYLSAGLRFPAYATYAEFPQLENGIGMAACLLRDLERLKRRKTPTTAPRFASATLVTGEAAWQLLERAAHALEGRCGVALEVLAVENELFGSTVTVAGLLAGRDMLSALRRARPGDAVVVPAAALNPDGLLLDNLSLADLSDELHRPVFAANSPSEVEDVLTGRQS